MEIKFPIPHANSEADSEPHLRGENSKVIKLSDFYFLFYAHSLICPKFDRKWRFSIFFGNFPLPPLVPVMYGSWHVWNKFSSISSFFFLIGWKWVTSLKKLQSYCSLWAIGIENWCVKNWKLARSIKYWWQKLKVR